MFVTHCGNKSQCSWRGNYKSCVIVTNITSPCLSHGVTVTVTFC
jgi:hypothetical protein